MSSIIPLILILITGVLTSITDIIHQKILNIHITALFILTAAYYLAAFLLQHEIPTLQLISCLVATIIGLLFFLTKLWRGGDAKLFILFAFLMPATGYEKALPLPSLTLFSCAFLAGSLFLLPNVIKTLIHNKAEILGVMLSRKTSQKLKASLINCLCLSWLAFPILSLFHMKYYSFFSFLMLFLIGNTLRLFYNLPLYKFIFIPILIAGLLLRTHFQPEFFHWPQWIYFPVIVIVYTLAGMLATSIIKHISDPRDRIPFAPFLFIGCLASYTPLLKTLLLLHK